MQFQWINKKENKDLIVFFNGWGMNETPVGHLKADNYDVLMLYDYRNLDFDFSQFDFSRYEKKHLVCWSMGVYAVNLFKDIFKNFDTKTAINGTTKIIDDDFGIPNKVYKVTVKFLNEDSLDKFIKNMFKGGVLNPAIKITRTLEELKEELISIQKIELKEELKFDRAIVSTLDRVVPTKNQINFWTNKACIEKIDSTHCPFENYSSWQEFV